MQLWRSSVSLRASIVLSQALGAARPTISVRTKKQSDEETGKLFQLADSQCCAVSHWRPLDSRNSQVDGVEVLQEYQTGIRSMSASTSVSASWMKESENNSRLLMDTPSTGHSDGITDLVTCSTGNQLFLVTASRDGIVKVWK